MATVDYCAGLVGVHVTYARAAKRLATCDGVSSDGNYTYKVAYEEAEAMLSDE